MVLDPLLVFFRDIPLPGPQDLFDDAPGEHRQGGGNVVLDIKPLRMPPLVGGRQTHRWVFVHPVVAEMNAGTSHRHAQLWLPNPLLRQVDGEEIPPQVEVGTNPQEPLTQGDKCRNVLDPIGSKVLQLHLVVIQQPLKELVGRGGESLLVKASRGHHVAFGQ